MQKAFVVILILFCATRFNAQDKLTKEHKEVIARFMGYFKSDDRQNIAKNISYPLKREYPLPEIKSKEEFLKRFDEVFDAKLIAVIIKSSPDKDDDWSAVGYHGIMMGKGSVWIDYDGMLLAVNYQSDVETKKLAELVALEKSGLHPSINKFVKPVTILLTGKYRIRIDDMGAGKYQYASWKLTAEMSDKPDLIIENGNFYPEGVGGNHSYRFRNGRYIYECDIIIIGTEDEAPAYLIVYKDGKEILSESADLVRH